MKPLATFRLAFILAVGGVMFTGCATHPGKPAAAAPATTATPPTFAQVQTAQTTAASNVFDGLTPGVVYNIEANAVGSAGPSDWSDPVPQMVV